MEPCGELVEWLMEAGPTEGDKALSWRELEAWADCTGNHLSEFSAVTLIGLSRAYYSMCIEARDENCPPPFAVRKTAEQEKQLGRRLSEALHAAAAARTNKRKK